MCCILVEGIGSCLNQGLATHTNYQAEQLLWGLPSARTTDWQPMPARTVNNNKVLTLSSTALHILTSHSLSLSLQRIQKYAGRLRNVGLLIQELETTVPGLASLFWWLCGWNAIQRSTLYKLT